MYCRVRPVRAKVVHISHLFTWIAQGDQVVETHKRDRYALIEKLFWNIDSSVQKSGWKQHWNTNIDGEVLLTPSCPDRQDMDYGATVAVRFHVDVLTFSVAISSMLAVRKRAWYCVSITINHHVTDDVT